MLTLHLLGAFHVELDGSPLTGFATDKARALLAYLAVEREYPHRREQLSTLLWPEQPEDRARQNLRQALSHIRHALGENHIPRYLFIDPQSAQLTPDAPVWTDVQTLRGLAQACREHQHSGIESCLPCLRRQQKIAELYRGEFLAGFSLPDDNPYEEWVALTRENLQIEAIQALQNLAAYEERRGQYDAARRYALEQVRFEPWREEAHTQAMRLLAYEGQRSAALAQYAACRRALQKELDLPPAPATRLLAEQIQNDLLDAPSPIPCPPPAPASFVGREHEQDELAEMLSNPASRLITLLGPGGMGKTRLALQVARSHAGLYRDGIYFVPLAAAPNCATALLTLAGRLQVPVAPGSDLVQALGETLRERQMLVVLDNFEQLTADCQYLGEIIRAAPRIKWMVTSRERLRLREEWVYPLDGLPLPDSPAPVSPLNEPGLPFAALSLFAERAAQADRHFELTPALLPDVTRICRLVEGLPLGIELAAAATSRQTCAQIAASLGQTFDSLHPDLRNLPERHASLRAAFEHSWGLLSPEQQDQLARLSVFPASFSPEAAFAVSGAPPQSLFELVEKSLLRYDSDGRYALHASVREFAREKLADDEPRHRLAEFFADFAAAQSGQLNGQGAGEALLRLQSEHANLRAAWGWAAGAATQAHLTARLLRGLGPLYRLRGPMSEGAEMLIETASRLEAETSAPSALMAELFIEIAALYAAMTEFETAIFYAGKAVQFAEQAGQDALQARACLGLAQTLAQQGEFDRALPPAEKALNLARACSEIAIEADSLRELGNMAVRHARDEDARQHYERALALYRQLGQRRGECAILNNMGLVLMNLGDYEQAFEHYDRARRLYAELGDLRGEAKALNNLSNVTAEQGRLDESLGFSQQALAVIEQTGNPHGKSGILHNMGATCLVLGQFEQAETYFKAALEDYRTGGNHQAEAEILSNLALLEYRRGNYAAAQPFIEGAIAYAEKAGDTDTLSNCLYYRGCAETAQGNFDRAETDLQQALALRPLQRHPAKHAEALAELAFACLQNGKAEEGKSMLERLFPILTESPRLEGVEDAPQVYWRLSQILSSLQDERAAGILSQGRALLDEQAGQISDPLMRESFLQNVASHRLLLMEK
jgi:predicted ATPase/DNA-binding SARP family transcriptional activator/Tfp pilus assembly protein PilF